MKPADLIKPNIPQNMYAMCKLRVLNIIYSYAYKENITARNIKYIRNIRYNTMNNL